MSLEGNEPNSAQAEPASFFGIYNHNHTQITNSLALEEERRSGTTELAFGHDSNPISQEISFIPEIHKFTQED